MEEIVTVDGRQFKLTVDRPLTAQEKAQVLTEIRKQTGCGTCGTRSLDPNWGYGGIRALGACTKTSIKGGDNVTLTANPNNGTAPYTVRFFKQLAGAPTTVTTDIAVAADGGTATYTYSATDLDITTAGPGTSATIANFDGSGLDLPEKTAGNVRFVVHTSDSCPTASGGAKHCIESCEITIVCPTPTCSFVVT